MKKIFYLLVLFGLMFCAKSYAFESTPYEMSFDQVENVKMTYDNQGESWLLEIKGTNSEGGKLILMGTFHASISSGSKMDKVLSTYHHCRDVALLVADGAGALKLKISGNTGIQSQTANNGYSVIYTFNESEDKLVCEGYTGTSSGSGGAASGGADTTFSTETR